jgi:uncharacterized phiE125 gp8 family phage protein
MAEPVSLETAKAHLRVTTTSEDTLIGIYIKAARQWVEQYTGHILSPRTFVQAYSAWGDYITLYYRPVTTVTTITYDSADEDQADFTDYEYSLGQHPMRIYPVSSFPTLRTNGYITVTYTAGYASAAEVPDALIQAILLMIGHFYTGRVAVGTETWNEIPLGVRSLCNFYRIPVIA